MAHLVIPTLISIQINLDYSYPSGSDAGLTLKEKSANPKKFGGNTAFTDRLLDSLTGDLYNIHTDQDLNLAHDVN